MAEREKSLEELKLDAVEKLEEALETYVMRCKEAQGDSSRIPSINELEDIAIELNLKTKDIYLELIGDTISGFNEEKEIERKKQNTP